MNLMNGEKISLIAFGFFPLLNSIRAFSTDKVILLN